MDKDLEQIVDTTGEQSGGTTPNADKQLGNASRRRFTRGAVVGSAVLLSLGNRAAWSDEVEATCVSSATWASYNGSKSAFISSFGAGDRYEDTMPDILSFEQKYNNRSDYRRVDSKDAPTGKTCVIPKR